MRVAVTARLWYRASDGGYHNSSFGGTIVGGEMVVNDHDFRSFVVTGGQVSFIYSNVGLVLGSWRDGDDGDCHPASRWQQQSHRQPAVCGVHA